MNSNSPRRPRRLHGGHCLAVARGVLHLSVLASGATTQMDPERKLQPFRDWKDSVFLQKEQGVPPLLDFGEAANPLNKTTPEAPWPTPILSSPTSSAPSLSLVNFPSLSAAISATEDPTGTVPTPILPATPPVVTPSPPFPLAPGPLIPTSVVSPPISSVAGASASPSENIDYGYEAPPTSVPMSIMPVIVESPSDNRIAIPPGTESPTGPSMDGEVSAAPSDPPSEVPSDVPSDAPSSVPTETSLSARHRPIINVTKFTQIHKLPRDSPSKAFSTLNSGKAGGKAGLFKSSKKAKSKSKKCRGSPKKSKAPSSLTKVPSLEAMSPSSKAPSSKTKTPHYCPPTSSPYPTITAEPTITGEPTTLEDVILRVNCEAMKRGQGPTTGPAQSYTVNFVLIISESVNATIQRLDDFLQTVVASNMAGCITDESTNITNVVFDVYEDDDMPACATDVPGTSCHHLNTDAKVYYKDDEVQRYNAEDFRKFLLRFCDDFQNLPGVETTFDPCSAMDVTDNGPAVSAATAARSAPMSNVSIGGLVGVVLAALFLILVVLFAARRKQKNQYALKHHALDEYDDSTYLKDDFEATSIGSKRRAHVVNEDDSIFSGLTSLGAGKSGRTGLDPPSSLLAARDVHVCTSATCEVCETRRQSGLQFIPAVMPSHSSDSLSRPRSFVAQDTVQL